MRSNISDLLKFCFCFTGGELFIGFLIAVAALLPVFAVYSVLQFEEVEQLFADDPGQALLVLEVLYYLCFSS